MSVPHNSFDPNNVKEIELSTFKKTTLIAFTFPISASPSISLDTSVYIEIFISFEISDSIQALADAKYPVSVSTNLLSLEL